MDQPDHSLTDHLRGTAHACNSAIAEQATNANPATREERLGGADSGFIVELDTDVMPVVEMAKRLAMGELTIRLRDGQVPLVTRVEGASSVLRRPVIGAPPYYPTVAEANDAITRDNASGCEP